MQQHIKKWGNAAAIRLPKSIMEQAQLSIDSTVDIGVKDGRIVIKPSRRRTYRLDELVGGITNENRHDEVDTDGPAGNEAL